MKLIREHINEKFTDVSDPIKDMGIGMTDWKDLKQGDIIKCIKFTQFSALWAPNGVVKRTGETIYNKRKGNWNGNLFEEGEYYRLLYDAEKREDGKIEIHAINVKYGNGSQRLVLTPAQLNKRFKVIKKGINEKFSEESDPIKDMNIGKEGMFKALEKRGIRMWFNWGGVEEGKKEGELEKQKVIDNIVEITQVVNKLESVGFDVKEMAISHHVDITVKTIEVIDSNHVIFNCATKEDANYLIKAAKKLSLWKYDNFSLGKGEANVSIHPSHHMWLDNLIENRKKYKNIR